MNALRLHAVVSLLLALLIAMLLALFEGGAVALADTAAPHRVGRSEAASAPQSEWAVARGEADKGAHADTRDQADTHDQTDTHDEADAHHQAAGGDDDGDDEARDRRNVEEFFDWDGSSRRHSRHAHSHGDEIVNFGHDSHLPAGARADSVVAIFGSVSSEGDAGDLVAILGDTRASGNVKDSAVAVMGSVHIDGVVGGDVVAVFGNVELGPHAEVKGDVTAVGGAVTRDPAAIVHGHAQSIGGFTAGFTGLRPWIDHCLRYGRPLALVTGIGWAWTLALILLGVYVCLGLLFRDAVTRCASTLETQPGMALVASLLSILIVPIAIVLLCITVIGIAAIPFVVFGLFCIGLFGKAVVLAWIGRRVLDRGERVAHPALAVLVGGLIVLVLYLIPVVGFLLYKLLGLFGFGAVIYTLILTARDRRPPQPVRGGPQAGRTAPFGAVPPAGAVPGATSAAADVAAASATHGESYAAPGADTASVGTAPAGTAAGAGAAGRAGAAGAASHSIDPAIAATLPRAGFWIRMAALLLDIVLIGVLMGLLHHSHDLELVTLAIYGALMWRLRGSTVGGIVFHLQVVRVDGRPIDWQTAIVRALGCFLSLVVAGLGFFWIAFDSGKQAWHDKIAGTAVVRLPRAVSLV